MANQTFTDDPKVAGVTSVSAIHFQELKDAINTWTAAYSLPTQVTTTISNVVSAPVVNQLITGLNYINTNSISGSDNWVTVDAVSVGELISILKVNTMVDNMKVAQNEYCASCDSGITGYNYAACSCNGPCNNYGSYCTCNSYFHPCICNGGCQSYCAPNFPGGCGCRVQVCGGTCLNCNMETGYSCGCDTYGTSCTDQVGQVCTKCYSSTNRYPW